MSIIVRLPTTLRQTVTLQPTSTSGLCARVAASRRFNRRRKHQGTPHPKPPAALAPTPSVSATPIELLRVLGLAMLPPSHTAYRLTLWHWTLIRYGYLVGSVPKGKPFGTSSLVGDYRNHHLTAVSEAFGVACALAYARAWLSAESPSDARILDPIDFDYLIGSGSPVPRLRTAINAAAAPDATQRPDYLIAAERPDRSVRLLVVECKGNSTSRSVSISQLGAAMHQLNGVEFGPSPARYAVDRHAYATRIETNGGPVEMLAVDPPAEGERWIPPAEEPAAPHASVAEYDSKKGRLELHAREFVRDRLFQRLAERALAWSGAAASADADDGDRVASEFGPLVGTLSSSRFSDGRRVEVFTGALSETIAAARTSDPKEAHELRMEAQRRVADNVGKRPAAKPIDEAAVDEERHTPDADDVALAVGETGLALRIAVH